MQLYKIIYSMFGKLISHSWQMMRRSAFFEKSMFAKGFIAFMVFFAVMQLFGLGRVLPVILNENFPDRAPAEWVYGVLPLILIADITLRFFIQKFPARHVKPYLHMPVQRGQLTIYWMTRSWLHPMNIYLLFFFYPFIQMTINPATSSQEAGLLGIFLLTGVNHSLLMLIWSPGKSGKWLGMFLLFVLLLTGLSYLWIPDQMMKYSLDFFLAFVYLKPFAFLLPILLITILHLVIYKQIGKNYYEVYEAEEKTEKAAEESFIERIISNVPEYGPYWLLEWRLLTRNRRTRTSFYSYIPMAMVYVIFAALWIDEPAKTSLAIVYLIMASGMGGLHLQHVYSWESHFFDFLASRDFSFETFIRAKYYFYLLLSGIQLLLVIIILIFLNPQLLILMTALTVYAAGLGFYIYFRAGIRHSSRMDLQAKASFNMEGVSGMKLLIGILQFFILLPLFIVGFIIPVPFGESILIAVVGLSFIINHRSWIKKLGHRLEARKHINLSLYREK
ncbi:MAG: hypothetical protein EA393_11750 [Bacteroidetes bacterium]|nr:MAG: hypothetical protein EA393_11750 [Bacteroidota bacterium]